MKIKFLKKDGNGKKGKWGKPVFLALVLIFVGGALFFWYKSRNAIAETNHPSVTFERIRIADISKIISAGGTVEIADITEVYGESQSKIKDVLFETDDYIEAGDTLVTYDIDDTRKALEQSLKKAEISLANAELSLAGISDDSSEGEFARLRNNIASFDTTIANINVSIEQVNDKLLTVRKKADDALADIERYAELLDVGGISEVEYKAYEKSYEDVQLEIKELENQISSYERSIEESLSGKSQAELELRIAQADKEKSVADTQLQYQRQLNEIETCRLNIAEIKDELAALTEATESTVSGVITTLNAVEGADVNASTPLAVVVDMENLIIKANISEYDAPKLKEGQLVHIMSDGFPDDVFSGKLSKISSIASEQSTSNGTETVVQIEVSIDNNNGSLKPGYTVDIEIIADEVNDVIAVPISALKTDKESGEKYVFLFDRGIARKMVITTGLSDDMYIEADGVEEGMSVITNPSADIADGVPVMSGVGGQRQGESRQLMFGPTVGVRQGGAVRQGGGGPRPTN